MTTEQWFEKATAYFGGSMSAEETALFEKETVASEELSQLMQLWKNTDAEATIYEQNKEAANAFITTHQQLKAAFINDEQEDKFISTKKSDTGKSTFAAWKWMAVAAAITGILLLLKVTMQQPGEITIARQEEKQEPNQTTPGKDSAVHLTDTNKEVPKNQQPTDEKAIAFDQLYAQAFTKDDAPENQNGPLRDAFFYYSNEQYKEAIEAIEKTKDNTSTRGDASSTALTDFYALYYKGLSMMLLYNTSGAIPVFKQATLLAPANELKVKAQWYLALAYIKEEKIAPAGETLQLLISNPAAGAYKSKAQKLLAALNK